MESNFNLYLYAGRPTEIPEHDVWLCESKYHEVDKNIRKLNKGLKVKTYNAVLFNYFHLILYGPVNNFSVLSGQFFLG